MACQKINRSCSCDFNIKSFGLCDPKRITINGSDRTVLNWSEISVPETLCIPESKPDIENLDQVYATAELTSVKLIETPFAYDQVDRLATADELTDLTAIVTAIDALTLGTLPTLIDGLLTALTGLGITITPAIELILNTIDTTLTEVTNALAELIDAAETLPANSLATAVCNLLNLLTDLIATLVTALNALVDALSSLTEEVGIDISAIIDPILAIITPLLTNLTVTITNLINNLIASLGSVSYITITPNEEGTCLTGRKLVIEGYLNQKIVYTGEVESQSVHSAHYSVPFSAFIVVYPNFEGLTYESNVTIDILVDGVVTPVTINGIGIPCTDETPELTPDLCEEFCVEAYIEDVFATSLDARTIFKNVTLFFLAKPSAC